MGAKKKTKVKPKPVKGGPKRRVTAAERAKKKELGIASGRNASRQGANQRKERARRRQAKAAKSKGCIDKLKRRLFSAGAEVVMNRRSHVVVGEAMRMCNAARTAAWQCCDWLCLPVLKKEISKLKLGYDLIDLEFVDKRVRWSLPV